MRLINGFTNPILALTVFSLQVLNCLSLPYMLFPDLVGKLLWSAFILKLFTTVRTLVMLDTSSFPILLYP